MQAAPTDSTEKRMRCGCQCDAVPRCHDRHGGYICTSWFAYQLTLDVELDPMMVIKAVVERGGHGKKPKHWGTVFRSTVRENKSTTYQYSILMHDETWGSLDREMADKRLDEMCKIMQGEGGSLSSGIQPRPSDGSAMILSCCDCALTGTVELFEYQRDKAAGIDDHENDEETETTEDFGERDLIDKLADLRRDAHIRVEGPEARPRRLAKARESYLEPENVSTAKQITPAGEEGNLTGRQRIIP